MQPFFLRRAGALHERHLIVKSVGVVVSVSGEGWVGSAWWMNEVCSWLWGGE